MLWWPFIYILVLIVARDGFRKRAAIKMVFAIYGAAVFFGVCIGIETQNAAARLVLGQAISRAVDLEITSRGLQDAITDPSKNVLFFLGVAAFIALLIFTGWQLHWLHVVGIVCVSFVVAIIVKSFLPEPGDRKYAFRILGSLANREADFRKQNDLMRAEAVKDIQVRIINLLERN